MMVGNTKRKTLTSPPERGKLGLGARGYNTDRQTHTHKDMEKTSDPALPAEVVSIHIHVEKLPKDVNSRLNTLAKLTNRKKEQLIRDAMIEYDRNHQHEIISILGVRA